MKLSSVDVSNVRSEDVRCDPCASRGYFIPRPDRKLLGPGPVHIGIVEGDDGRHRYAKIFEHDGHLGCVEMD